MSESEPKDHLTALTAQIVASYVQKNSVPTGELRDLMALIFDALKTLGGASGEPRRDPAVPPNKSVFPDYLICLEDGKKLKMLKRHLKTAYAMTPDQYRQRWSLPADYPMVAPNYAKHRSRLAKRIGLGTTRTSRKKAA